MRKIHKIANIALIFTLIGVVLCRDIAYAAPNLRANLMFDDINQQGDIERTDYIKDSIELLESDPAPQTIAPNNKSKELSLSDFIKSIKFSDFIKTIKTDTSGQLFGRFVALPLALLAACVILTLAPFVKKGSPGPVFFIQERIGYKGKPIFVPKLRTYTNEGDVNLRRLTLFGRATRRTALDELPQIFSIVLGDMQWFGPRPESEEHVTSKYRQKYIDTILSRTPKTKPGLFGWTVLDDGIGMYLPMTKERIDILSQEIEQQSVTDNIHLLFTSIVVIARSCLRELYKATVATASRKNIPSQVAIVGLGDWGKRTVLGTLDSSDNRYKYIEKFHLVAGSNAEEVQAEFAQDSSKIVYRKDQIQEVLGNPLIPAIIIVTPFISHYDLAKQALKAGKDVFVEKPFVMNSDQARELIELAERNNCILMVGYEFMYDPRFLALKQLVTTGGLGDVQDVRINLVNRNRALKEDAPNVVEELVTHQLSMLQLLFGTQEVSSIKIWKAEHCPETGRQFINASFQYGNVQVTVTTGINYFKESNYRDIRIVGSERTITLDYGALQPSFKLENTQTYETVDINYPDYPQELRKLSSITPVQSELDSFFSARSNKSPPVSSGTNAVHIVELTEAINSKFKQALKRHKRIAAADRQALHIAILQQMTWFISGNKQFSSVSSDDLLGFYREHATCAGCQLLSPTNDNYNSLCLS